MLTAKRLADSLKISFTYLMTGTQDEASNVSGSNFFAGLTESEKFEGIFKISVQRLLPVDPTKPSKK